MAHKCFYTEMCDFYCISVVRYSTELPSPSTSCFGRLFGAHEPNPFKLTQA